LCEVFVDMCCGGAIDCIAWMYNVMLTLQGDTMGFQKVEYTLTNNIDDIFKLMNFDRIILKLRL
jgi:hypothetical protein